MSQAKTLTVVDRGKTRILQEGDVIDLHFNFTASLAFDGDLPVFIVRNGAGSRVWRRGTLNACYAKAWEYTSNKSGLSYKALQAALDAEDIHVDSSLFTGRYVVVCESDGCETYFYAEDALIVPVDELDQERLKSLAAGESKVFSHGGPIPTLRLGDLLIEAENQSDYFMHSAQKWAIAKSRREY